MRQFCEDMRQENRTARRVSQILTRKRFLRPLAPSKLLRWLFGLFWWLARTKPEREMGGLYCLLDDRQQLRAQLVQVHLLAQRLIEARHDLSRIILAAIKAPIHQLLHAP